MRLICPNCGAQYEVPDDVIPRTGRDVQCSNCGNTWFQVHPDHDVDLADELEQPIPESQSPAQNPTPPQADTDVEEQQDEAHKRRRLDPSVADILREEAEHEARAREAERGANGLESQPDLGLSDPDTGEAARRAREARERMARMQGLDQEPQTTETTASSRRGLLPDIDEINSSLRSTSDRRPSEADDYDRPGNMPSPRPQVTANGSGFRIGFSSAVAIAIALFCLYAFAEDIAAQFPQLDAPLARYVDAVTGVRLWLDAQAQAALIWLQQTANDVL